MTLQLFSHPFSSYCQKVLIALYENATRFEQRMRTKNVRLEKNFRRVDRPIHVRLGGKMYHRIDLFARDYASQQIEVPDVAMDKTESCLRFKWRE